MLIGLLERSQIERYGRMRGRFEEFGITSVFQSTDASKVIGFYGHLAVRDLEIHLDEITAAFFLQTNERRVENTKHIPFAKVWMDDQQQGRRRKSRSQRGVSDQTATLSLSRMW